MKSTARRASASFVRIATNARIFTVPLTVPDEIGYVDDWLDQPNIELLVPGRGHLDIAFGLLRQITTAGTSVPVPSRRRNWLVMGIGRIVHQRRR